MTEPQARRGRPRKDPKDVVSQTEANKRWQAANKDRAKYLQYRSTARSFIRNHATADDLDELRTLIAERSIQLGQYDNNYFTK
jgi:hypothetical protein